MERLGLNPETVEVTAKYKALDVRESLDNLEHRDASAHEHPGPGAASDDGLIDYITTQGFRALGLLALVDQEDARDFGERLLWGLGAVGHPSWPLALAVADVSDTQRRIPDLFAVPPAYPVDLAWLLLSPAQPLDAPRPEALRGDQRRYGRGGLAPYRIDIRVLSALARGGNTTQRGYVSEPSAPAVVGALFGSMEDALGEARRDAHHWQVGATPISPTDPEVLLTVRVVLGSAAGWALRGAVAEGELSMIGAVVDLVDALAER
jgi:hypothetical protein